MKEKKIIAKDCLKFDEAAPDDVMRDFVNAKHFIISSKQEDEIASYDYHSGKWIAGRYIGECRITSGNRSYHIVIRPRFGKAILETLLYKILNIKILLSDSNYDQDEKEWSQFLIYLQWIIWVSKFTQANRYGLPRRSVKHEFQGDYIHGHINIMETVRRTLQHGDVASECYIKEFQSIVCSIIYEAYIKLYQTPLAIPVAMPNSIKQSLNQLSSLYKLSHHQVTESEYASIKYRNIDLLWKPLVDFSWQIIKNSNNLVHSIGENGSGVFIDMAEIWEQYLRQILTDEFSKIGWTCVMNEINTYTRQFYTRKIIPDIILQKENHIMVFDAKYKHMGGFQQDLDRGDFFQIHSYIQYLNNKNHVVLGGLLYPLVSNPDLNTYHSNSLFGLEVERTKFIIDGIFIKDNDTKETLAIRKDDFLKRISDLISS
jgi:5-methylcytosine-specific restriction enzyme subunit McrC